MLSTYGANEYLKIVQSPFNPLTDTAVIGYVLPEPGGYLTIAVYDLAGRTVATLVRGKISTIEGETCWLGRNESNRLIPVGIYIVNLEYRVRTTTYQAKLPLILARPL